jgi:deoxycytidylate deaminase
VNEIGSYAGAELILGLVAPVGTDLSRFVETLRVCMQAYSYRINDPVRLSELTEAFHGEDGHARKRSGSREYLRIMRLMDAGNAARRSGGSDVMALAAASAIHAKRRTNKLGQKEPLAKHAHVIWSLKHPAEVLTLRRVYGPGFYLIGVVTEPSERREFLETRKGCHSKEIDELVQRDEHEGDDGQRTRDTFELADVFVRLGDIEGLKRFLRLVFGDPYETPQPDEHAMFLAFAAGLRSSDLSRQVGAVLLSANGDVIAVRTNDVPTAGGGLFWAGDRDDDRDLRRGCDTNQIERTKIVDEILTLIAPTVASHGAALKRWLATGRKKLQSAAVMDITEYGRAVHAEMEAPVVRKIGYQHASCNAVLDHLPVPQLREAHHRSRDPARRVCGALSEEPRARILPAVDR